jgi:hypothetical protein
MTNVRGAAGFIMSTLGVPYWVASIMKYGVIILAVSGTFFIMKADYDADRRQEGYDKCVQERAEQVDTVRVVTEETNAARDAVIEADRAEQRETDMITRERYDDLKTDRDELRREFTRLLRKASAADPNGCINRDMPIELQRRVGD